MAMFRGNKLMRKIKRYIIRLIEFLKNLLRNRYLLFELTKRDVISQFKGSVLGIIWAIIQPLMALLALWFAVTVGLRGGAMRGGVPFLVFLAAGRLAWDLISKCLNSTTNSLQVFSYVIKKANFSVGNLPIVKLLSSIVTNAFFLVVVIIIILAHGYFPTVYWLQLLYYLPAAFILLLGLGWITSSIALFLKDTNKIITVILSWGFWLTPIIWDINAIPEKYHWILKLNPFSYIVLGYRNSLIYGVPFWEDVYGAVVFWIWTILSLFFGIIIFKKLRPHFGDVLH